MAEKNFYQTSKHKTVYQIKYLKISKSHNRDETDPVNTNKHQVNATKQ